MSRSPGHGGLAKPFTTLRAPKTLRPAWPTIRVRGRRRTVYYETGSYHALLDPPGVQEVAQYLATFKEFPPPQRPASFTIDQIIEKMQKSLEGASR